MQQNPKPIIVYKDYLPYTNLEPRDFTRIHDQDLNKLRSVLRLCYSVFSDRNFTDRHGMADVVKSVLDKGSDWIPTVETGV